MTNTDLHRLSTLRSLIEGFAARHAASCAAEDARPLGVILARLNSAVLHHDYPSFHASDYELHEGIVLLAGVPLLRETWLVVWNGLQEFHKIGFQECFPDARILMEEHEHLVETILLGDPAAAEDAARAHVEAVWFRLAERQGSAATTPSDPLQRAAAHLAFRMHCPLHLCEVAETVAFTSPGNLSRLFRQRYGVSFQGYLQRLRLEKAAELLRTTRLPVASIARRVGYRDVSRFGQHFKRIFGEPPALWRKNRVA